MPKELPQKPSLEHLRKEAKALLRRNSAHDPAAALLGGSPATFAGHASQEILARALRLCDAQRAVALQYGFPGWSQLKAHVDSISGARAAMAAPVDAALISDPAHRSTLAAQKGLPPVGTVAVSQYGMRYTVVDHAFAMTLATVARVGDGDAIPTLEELLPVLSFSGMSQRLTDLYVETDCCTSKELVFMDSMPEIHPGSAAPNVHQVLTTQDPRCLVFHLDAADLHETILAHELGHIWIETVEGCEDYRIPRFLADMPKTTQFQLIQSFALDFRVNALLQQRGFDLNIVDAEYFDAIVHIADHCARGDRPRTARAAAALVNTVAAAMIDHDRWPQSAVGCLEASLSKIRIGLPEVYRAARAFVAAVETHGVADRGAICRVIDECALVSFQLTGDDFDPERDLEEMPPTEWMRDKHPDFLAGLPVATKLRVWRAMAKQGIGPRIEYRIVPVSRGVLEITVRDASGRNPAPPVLNLCIPAALIEERAVQSPMPAGQGLGPAAKEQATLSGFRDTAPRLPGVVKPLEIAVPPLWDPFGMLRDGAAHGAGRRYMPGVGRWLSRVGFEAQRSEHPYAYGDQNPVVNLDPSGETGLPSVGAPSRSGAAAIAGGQIRTTGLVDRCKAMAGFVDNPTRPRCACAGNHNYSPEFMLCILWQESNWGQRPGPGGAGRCTKICFDQLKRVRKCGWIGKFKDYADFVAHATPEEKVWAAQDYLGCEGVGRYGPPSGYPVGKLEACAACIQSGLHSVAAAQDYPCDVAPCCARLLVHL